MLNSTLNFDSLHITAAEIYEQMGYGDVVPDDDVLREMVETIREIKSFLRPRYMFFVVDGHLDIEQNTLSIAPNNDSTTVDGASARGQTDFQIGQIIARQLRNSEAYAFFVATAGMEFEHYLHRLKDSGDMVRLFIADSIGSIIAEKAADLMEQALAEDIQDKGWRHTNRFSPGYCGWHVSQQQLLFPLFGSEPPCGITLSESSLMTPIKSVSGVIGLGSKVKKLEYTCGLCTLESCYKRRRRGK